MQTQTAKEHLQSFHHELKAAAEKNGEQAKARIRAALDHADAAKAALQAKVKSDNAQTKSDAQAAMQKLQDATRSAKAALDAKGAEIQTHLKDSIAAAKAALDE